jgi:hypothetical protein
MPALDAPAPFERGSPAEPASRDAPSGDEREQPAAVIAINAPAPASEQNSLLEHVSTGILRPRQNLRSKAFVAGQQAPHHALMQLDFH